MIKYSLGCENGHAFEGWFAQSADFDRQVESGFLTCPVCNSTAISKSLMAPSVSTARKKEAKQELAMNMARHEVMAKLKEAVAGIRASSEDVGEKFPEEARKIHYGESETRQIFGEASLPDVKGLVEEGISVMPLPPLPEDKN